jgi:HEPN domain-containing protein
MSIKISKEWLKASKIDLDSIHYIINVEHLTPVVAFHAQQSVEKALKALLLFNDAKIPRIHSLNKLFKLVEEYLKVDGFELIDMLDDLYIESRYPGDMGLLPYGQPTLDDAKEFHSFAQEIFDKVNAILY